jgi:hypothetical protein
VSIPRRSPIRMHTRAGQLWLPRGCNPPVNHLFCPEDPATRGQLAAFLRRVLGGMTSESVTTRSSR